MPRTEKQKTGGLGEDIAVKHLEKHGYRILERNVRRPWGEIDIVVKRGKLLVFVEVKALKSTESLRPEDHLTSQKLHKFRRTCELYLQENNLTKQECRMDAIFIDIGPDGEALGIRHIEGIETQV